MWLDPFIPEEEYLEGSQRPRPVDAAVELGAVLRVPEEPLPVSFHH